MLVQLLWRYRLAKEGDQDYATGKAEELVDSYLIGKAKLIEAGGKQIMSDEILRYTDLRRLIQLAKAARYEPTRADCA